MASIAVRVVVWRTATTDSPSSTTDETFKFNLRSFARVERTINVFASMQPHGKPLPKTDCGCVNRSDKHDWGRLVGRFIIGSISGLHAKEKKSTRKSRTLYFGSCKSHQSIEFVGAEMPTHFQSMQCFFPIHVERSSELVGSELIPWTRNRKRHEKSHV